LRNFQHIASGIDVVPLLHALQRRPELWNKNPLRTTFQGTPHVNVDDILIRFNDAEPYARTANPATIMDEHESIWHPATWELPQVRGLIFPLLARVEGERLGRCIITRVPPGGRINPHVDSGSHAAYYERYHIVLQGLPGSIFRCGQEVVQMLSGQVWWFDNGIEHEVINNSADDRVHLIVDIRIARFKPTIPQEALQ
jgi:quercetin dioxygenase-like cupin family protein